jgi:hypothetical protein
MQIKYKIFELVAEEKVTFAGYSGGYGRETQTVYGFVIPQWANYSYETEEEAMNHLEEHCKNNTSYEIRKIYY